MTELSSLCLRFLARIFLLAKIQTTKFQGCHVKCSCFNQFKPTPCQLIDMESARCNVAFNTDRSETIKGWSKETCLQSRWSCMNFKFKFVAEACHGCIHSSTAPINELGQHRICWLKIKGCCWTAIANQMGRNIECIYAKDSKRDCKRRAWRAIYTLCPYPSRWKTVPPVFFLMHKTLSSSQQFASVIIDPVVIYLRA